MISGSCGFVTADEAKEKKEKKEKGIYLLWQLLRDHPLAHVASHKAGDEGVDEDVLFGLDLRSSGCQ
jgi:hypothetical protein